MPEEGALESRGLSRGLRGFHCQECEYALRADQAWFDTPRVFSLGSLLQCSRKLLVTKTMSPGSALRSFIREFIVRPIRSREDPY